MGNPVFTGLVTMVASYIPDSVKQFLAGWGTYITAWITVLVSGLSLGGVDVTSLGVTPENAVQLFVGAITVVFMRRAIGNNTKETQKLIQHLKEGN